MILCTFRVPPGFHKQEKLMKVTALGVLLAAGAAACSGGGGAGSEKGGNHPPATCSTFSACGGDLVGTWNIVATCGPGTIHTFDATTIPNCTGVKVRTTTAASGTMTFDANSSYVGMFTNSNTEEVVLPKTCAGSQSCDAYYLSLLNPANPPPLSGSCTDDGTNCSCTHLLSPQHNAVDGTYTVAGTTLTLTLVGGQPFPTQYCAETNELTISTIVGSDASTALVYTLTKQ
jgi:hypothetical protein